MNEAALTDAGAGASAILLPFFGMMLLTFVVWLYMYARRLSYLARYKIPTQELTTPEKGAARIPEQVHYPALNFRNLFELPVLFYALCLYLYASGSTDALYLAMAWAFLTLRAAHSWVHCTVNIVKLRFVVYMASAFVLWAMIGRAALGVV